MNDLIKFDKKIYKMTFKPATVDFPEYDKMKKQVDQLNADYMKYEVTTQNLKSAKATRAELNKFRKAIDERRKEIVSQADQPISDFKAKIKALTDEINEASNHINQGIKAYEDEAKANRHTAKVAAIKKMAMNAAVNWEKIDYDSKWDNKSCSAKVFRDEVKQQILALQDKQKALQSDIKVIRQRADELNLASNHYIYLLKTQDLATILQEMEEERKDLNEIARKQKLSRQQAARDLKQYGDKAIDAKTGEVVDKLYTVQLQITATKDQLQRLASFMKDWAIKAERVR